MHKNAACFPAVRSQLQFASSFQVTVFFSAKYFFGVSRMTLRSSARNWVSEKLASSQFFWRHVRRRQIEDAWWALRAPAVSAAYKAARRSEEEFYQGLFMQHGIHTVFDIGGNCGDKTDVFLSAGARRILLIEPDPHWSKIHQWRFQGDHRVTRCECAVSSSNGTAVLQRFAPGSPLNTLENRWVEAIGSSNGRFEPQSLQDSTEVQAFTVEALANRYWLPDYCKVDVEGHELSVLRGIQQLPRLLSLEFNLPEFETELKECLHLISSRWPTSNLNFVTEYGRGFELSSWRDSNGLLSALGTMKPRYLELFVAQDINDQAVG